MEKLASNTMTRKIDSTTERVVWLPTLPAQAVPGIYMLFVVDKNGVPSGGRKLRLEPESRGQRPEFR